MKYKLSSIVGTFDHFHKGHQTLLNHAFLQADKIIVGITSDDFVEGKRLSSLIESFKIRQQSVLDYAKNQGKLDYIEIVQLNDMFGPTLTDFNIDCLVVSPLTEFGAKIINQKRAIQKFSQLPIEICNLELSSDQRPISSSRIRAGEINRQGFVYSQLLKENITISENQKLKLKKPFGDVYANTKDLKNSLTKLDNIIAVGDTATRLCIENNIAIAFGVFDNLEKRQKVNQPLRQIIINKLILKASNPPGHISCDLVQKLIQAIKSRAFVEVEGEEDLAVIPLILLLPIGSKVLYGQPGEGIVLVKVTEETKNQIKQLLDKSYKN